MATPRPAVTAAIALLAIVPLAAYAVGRGGQLEMLSAAFSTGCVILIAASLYWLFDGPVARPGPE